MDHESNDRSAGDYVLFGLAFLGFMIAAGGVVLSSVAIAVTGLFVLLLAFFCFWAGQLAGA